MSDLLAKGEAKKLKLRRNQAGKWFAENLTEIAVESPKQVFALLEKAQKKRFTRGTDMNEGSSRSHLIVSLTTVEVEGSGKKKTLKSAKLNLVDLAGSERVK